jgi:hypothetical protein
MFDRVILTVIRRESYDLMPPCIAQLVKFILFRIVAYLLKARAVEPEKQPLLGSGSETTFVSRHQLDKHVSAGTDMMQQ